MAGWNQGGVSQELGQSGLGVAPGLEPGLTWASLLVQTYSLYRTQFLAFFRMALLPVILAYLFRQLWWLSIRPFLVHLLSPTPPRRFTLEEFGRYVDPPWYSYFLNVAKGLSLVEGAVYWMLSAFLFAAVAANVLGSKEQSRPLADDYTAARERIGLILLIGAVASICFDVARLVANAAVFQVIFKLHLGRILSDVLVLVPTILICGLLSRLGLTIPELLREPAIAFSAAVKNSFRKSENWEPFFMMFAIKGAIAVSVVSWLTRTALFWLWHNINISLNAYEWIEGIVYICLAAALETPLFIAFSLLSLSKSTKAESSIPAALC